MFLYYKNDSLILLTKVTLKALMVTYMFRYEAHTSSQNLLTLHMGVEMIYTVKHYKQILLSNYI